MLAAGCSSPVRGDAHALTRPPLQRGVARRGMFLNYPLSMTCDWNVARTRAAYPHFGGPRLHALPATVHWFSPAWRIWRSYITLSCAASRCQALSRRYPGLIQCFCSGDMLRSWRYCLLTGRLLLYGL